MNFEIEQEELNLYPTSSGLNHEWRSKLCPREEELAELVWHNNQVFKQSLRPPKISSQKDAVMDVRSCEPAAEEGASRHLVVQEDELASWIHNPYPLEDSFDRDFCADLLCTSPARNSSHFGRINQIHEENKTLPPRSPAIPPPRHVEQLSSSESRPPISDTTARESTVICSNDTPAVGSGSRVSVPFSVSCSMRGDTSTTDVMVNCEQAVTSSSAGSGGSADRSVKPPKTDRKRKGIETDDGDWNSEDLESGDAKKQDRWSNSARRRARVAEVHNLSERKRRDRINEKMKALQDLIPRCNKSDKASMLDEAIEYLKSLQLQVQMMSMGFSMVPMIFPGVQQYMHPMGMGMGMGMGMQMQMGMDMGMSRPMLPFSSVLAGSAMPNPAAAAHFSQRLPFPPFHLPAVSPPDISRMQALNQSDQAMNSISNQSLNQQQNPSSASTSTVPWPPSYADITSSDSSHGPAKHQ
ncbi:hypothetical protein NE237_014771 [Protea cynaroides]|uniref:BHLH domain-containing protein n=1 Tax=Protea cynaroides TaxID=273540 RepID=A0A9Q0QQF3_9MAGN|nr:hypothetical protein NE237_014771 [Protea cynaroides]